MHVLKAVETDAPKADGQAASPHARLVAAASRLFCRYGINATGVDAVIAEAGTAKTTLYKLFGSKDGLVEAVLEQEGRQWREWFAARVEAGGGAGREKLAAIFPALKEWFAQERFFGCPFINAIGEHDKSEDRLRQITLAHKKRVLSQIEGWAGECGVKDATSFAHQIGVLMDGAIVAAMVTRDPSVADHAGVAASALLDRAAPQA